MLVRTTLDDPRWGELVATSAAATPFHHPAWAGLLGRCYAFRPLVLAQSAGDELVAGVPLLDVRLLLRSRRWVGLPFTDELAVLARSDDDRHQLVGEIARRQAVGGYPEIELRTALGPPARQTDGDALIHRLRLEDPDRLLARMDSRHRQGVRQAGEGRLRVRVAGKEEELTSDFYRLHLATRRRQGVPVQPRRYFSLLWQEFIGRGLGFVLLADDGDRVVGGAVFLSWNGTMVYKYAASDPSAFSARPNHLLLWEAMRRGAEQGDHTLDLGRTAIELEGLARFKRRWGATEEPLRYSLVGSGAIRPAQQPIPRIAGAIIRRSPAVVTRAAGTMLYRRAA